MNLGGRPPNLVSQQPPMSGAPQPGTPGVIGSAMANVNQGMPQRPMPTQLPMQSMPVQQAPQFQRPMVQQGMQQGVPQLARALMR
jgi:hypothetical protein